MNCPNCNSEKVYKNGKEPGSGKQKYKCGDCGKSFYDSYEKGPVITKSKPAVGISLTEFRAKFDVDFIVKETVEKLDPNVIYEKNDIIKLSGLRPGYPGLSATIEAQKNYYGKIGSTLYFSHPRTIEELKSQAKLS